jgi:hypothetical protein
MVPATFIPSFEDITFMERIRGMEIETLEIEVA